MASNEEILKDLNWSNDSDPGRYSLFTGLINPAMDAARKDEIEAWEEWKMERNKNGNSLQLIGGIWYFSVYKHGVSKYTSSELYTIFKQQNS